MDSNRLVFYDEKNEKHDRCLKEFSDKYSSLPGMIDISADNWDGATFMVTVDKKNFDMKSLPKIYDCFDVCVRDAYEDRNYYQSTVDEYMINHKELTTDDVVIKYHKRLAEKFTALIAKYENAK